MKKCGKTPFGLRILFGLALPGLALLMLAVPFPGVVVAAGDGSGDAKLQTMRADIEACVQPGDAGQKAREAFAKKYNVPLSKVNEDIPKAPPAGNGAWDMTTAKWVCGLEIFPPPFIGGGVWAGRGEDDKYKFARKRDAFGFAYWYCVDYSMSCDHYKWQKGCLKKQKPDCCN